MGQKEDLFQNLETAIPALRRYARALCACAGSAAADELVQTALERAALRIRGKGLSVVEGNPARLCAYSALTALAKDKMGVMAAPRPAAHQPLITHGLAGLPFDERASLLLVALEGFSYEAAASILAVPPVALVAQLRRARAALLTLDLRPLAPSDRSRRASAHLRVIK